MCERNSGNGELWDVTGTPSGQCYSETPRRFSTADGGVGNFDPTGALHDYFKSFQLAHGQDSGPESSGVGRRRELGDRSVYSCLGRPDTRPRCTPTPLGRKSSPTGSRRLSIGRGLVRPLGSVPVASAGEWDVDWNLYSFWSFRRVHWVSEHSFRGANEIRRLKAL